MSILFLVGARASGKTTLGKRLSQCLDLPFADTDHYLLRADGRTVADIVAAEGWPGFRAKERAALLHVTRTFSGGGVVSTGGGIVLDAANRNLMRERGTVFYLSAPIELLAERLRRNPLTAQRPSLTGSGLIEELRLVLEERQPFYRSAAHHILDARRPLEELCREIKGLLAAPPAENDADHAPLA